MQVLTSRVLALALVENEEARLNSRRTWKRERHLLFAIKRYKRFAFS